MGLGLLQVFFNPDYVPKYTILIRYRSSNAFTRDLCFERAALNIMALSCIYREKQITYDSKTVTTLMRTNIERVNADLAEPDFLDAPANIFRY